MRSLVRVTAILLSLFVGVAAGYGQTKNSENTLKLDKEAGSPAATIQDLSWLTGHWIGTGLGGECEEIWGKPANGSMIGTFRLDREGKTVFSEHLALVEEEGSLVLKVKHFTDKFIAWEEKEDFVRFPLVRLADGEAFFSGLTFRRQGADGLSIYLVLSQGEKRTEHEFRFKRFRAGGVH